MTQKQNKDTLQKGNSYHTHMKKYIFGAIGIVVLSIAWFLLSPLWRNIHLNESLPSNLETTASSTLLTTAPMIAQAHEVSGTASIIQVGEKKYLRFENLDTVNGPDLRIYLSADLENTNSIDLGPIRATQGNVNYELPADVDIETFRYPLIWCRAFRVLFSSAEFQL